MSYEELASVHTVDVMKLVSTQQADGTRPKTPVVERANVSCRVRDLTGIKRRIEGRDTVEKTHIVYFPANPNLKKGQYLKFGEMILRTIAPVINDHNLDEQWHVDCRQTTFDTKLEDWNE